MLDINAVYNKFIEDIRAGVGSYLSTSGTGANERPSVQRQRADTVKANYPYITIDIASIGDESGWRNLEDVDDNDFPYVETVKELLIVLRCYGPSEGSNNINALFIMNTLNGFFKLSRIRDGIRTDLGGSIVSLSVPRSIPMQLSDRFLETAEFSIIYNQVDRTTDTVPAIIDTVDIEPTIDDTAIENIVITQEEY